MADKTPPTPELLRKLLRYEPETGRLFWRVRSAEMFATERHWKMWNTRYADKEAFKMVDNNGYRQGCIFDAMYRSHRVIWAMVHGEWPADQIDHINGDASDNRIKNLRVVSQTENAQNQKRSAANASGVTGVCWDKHRSRWSAFISHRGRIVRLGRFTDFSEAVAVRSAAEKKYGYHPNHGRDAQ